YSVHIYLHSFPTRRSSDLIFSRRTDSFVIESIELSPVTASGKADAEALTIGDQRAQPLHFWIAASGDRARMGKVVAAEIASLLRSEEHTSELQSRGHLVCR